MTTKTSSLLDAIQAPASPFPGLRPFESNENDLFFGRDEQTEKMMDKLAATRFLAVVGTSGSGKSSLVRAGLMPALHSGMMAGAGSKWRIAVMRPSNDPIGNLARALNAPEVFGSDDAENQTIQIAVAEATLRLGSRGLIETVCQNLMPQTENLLVVVDQFEELFRFAREARKARDERYDNDAAAFVKLLLEAVKPEQRPSDNEANIHVVLTMRSDFLGDCSQFWDLPEAINESQYLIPRLTRDQLREVIEGPVAIGGGRIAPRLVNQLLNDITDNQDQLPILQHALMRTWDEWKHPRHEHQPSPGVIDICCYEATGGMAEALSRHADEAYGELDTRHKKIAEKMFKALTEIGQDNREIRRPVTLGILAAVAEVGEDEVKTVIGKFCQPGRSFLMPPAKTPPAEDPLHSDTLIDISHESLIRVWKQLQEWATDEAKSRSVYAWLVETVDESRELLRGTDLTVALRWRAQQQPNKAWARLYGKDESTFDQAINFLNKSRAEARHKKVARVASIVIAFATLSVFTLYARYQQQSAKKQESLAREQEQNARQLLYVANMNLAQEANERGYFRRVYELLNIFLPPSAKTASADLRGFDWRYLWLLNHQEAATLKGHVGGVNSISATRDGQTLASGGSDGTVRLWEVKSGQETQLPKRHNDDVWSVSLSADGSVLASGSEDKTVKLWDVKSRSELATLSGHDGSIYSVSLTADGGMLASGSGDKTVRLWELKTRQPLVTLRGHEKSVRSVSFSPDGRLLASAGEDKTIKLWEVGSRREIATLKGHKAAVYSVSFSPDGRLLASGSEDRTVKLWEVSSRRELATLNGHEKDIRSVSFAPDGSALASGSWDWTIKLWNVKSRELLTTLKGHEAGLNAVSFMMDGKTLASGSWDGIAKLWQLKEEQFPTTLKGYSGGVRSISFSSDGKIMAGGSDGGTIKLWDMESGKALALLNGHQDDVWAVSLSRDGTTLASGSMDRTVKLWEVKSRQNLAVLTGHGDAVRSVAFSPDGRILASASSDKTVKLWDVGGKQEPVTLNGHKDKVNSVAFSPDGKLLASGSEDNTVKLWDVSSRQELATLPAHDQYVWAVSFSADGKTLASASWDKSIKLWDVKNKQEIATLKGHEGIVNSVSFTPDGKTLASGSWDNNLLGGEVKLWDLKSGQVLATLRSQEYSVLSVSFSPDGRILAVGCWKSTADREGKGEIQIRFAVTEAMVEAQRNR